MSAMSAADTAAAITAARSGVGSGRVGSGSNGGVAKATAAVPAPGGRPVSDRPATRYDNSPRRHNGLTIRLVKAGWRPVTRRAGTSQRAAAAGSRLKYTGMRAKQTSRSDGA